MQETDNDFLKTHRQAIVDLPWKFFGGIGALTISQLSADQQHLVDQLHGHHFGSKRDDEFHVSFKGEQKHSVKYFIMRQACEAAGAKVADIFMKLPWQMSFNKLYGEGVTDIYLALDKKMIGDIPEGQQAIFKLGLDIGAIEKDPYSKSTDGKDIYLARNIKLLEKLCDKFNIDPDRRVNVRYERLNR